MKYDAFVSYSRDDSRIAKALQDNLHRLAKRWDALSSLRVFRDVTNLPIAALEPALMQALTDSKFLVLLASPQSAASTWVRQEVTHFLETHPSEQVLIVLIGGDLVWDQSLGDFGTGATSPLPRVDALSFAKEPLFLDLRWAVDELNLSVSNPRFLDAVATLAATLQEVPKETLIGDLVEEQRRLRRNQRINVGFRGAFGFGVAAGVFFLLGAAFSHTSDAVLSSNTVAYLYFAIGFPTIGALGALCCGLGWRGVLGFAVSFFVLLPMYIISSLRPFETLLPDFVVLNLISLVGFITAGALGAAVAPKISWSDGAKAFGFGGVSVVLSRLVLEGFRPDGLHTALMSWPWLSTRFWLLGCRGLVVAAEVFRDRETGILIPLIVGVAVGGLSLGVRLANARIPLAETGGEKYHRFWRWLPVGYALTATLLLAIAFWTFGWTEAHQVANAKRMLGADVFREFLSGASENIDREVKGNALRLTLRVRNALDYRGEHAAAADFSNLIRNTLNDFGQAPSLWYERYKNPGYQPPDIGGIAQALKDLGRPDELTSFLEVVCDHLNDADGVGAIMAARTEMALGSKKKAEEALMIATSKVASNDWFGRSLAAQTFFELGYIEASKESLNKLVNDITASAVNSPGAVIGLGEELAPESGDSFWQTGVWNRLTKWHDELSELLATAIEAMCRRGERETLIPLILKNREKSGLLHAQARFAKAAAKAQQYDTAFAVLDAFKPIGEPGWTYYDDTAQALFEIISVASVYGDMPIVSEGVTRLRSIEREVRQRSELNRFAGVTIAKAYASAGDYNRARSVANDVTDGRWEAELEIGNALSTTGRRLEAESMFAMAWKNLLQNSIQSSSPVPDDALSAIGVGLAGIGELKAARSVADDIGSDFLHYGGNLEALSQFSIHIAILEHASAMKHR